MPTFLQTSLHFMDDVLASPVLGELLQQYNYWGCSMPAFIPSWSGRLTSVWLIIPSVAPYWPLHEDVWTVFCQMRDTCLPFYSFSDRQGPLRDAEQRQAVCLTSAAPGLCWRTDPIRRCLWFWPVFDGAGAAYEIPDRSVKANKNKKEGQGEEQVRRIGESCDWQPYLNTVVRVHAEPVAWIINCLNKWNIIVSL